MLYEVITFFDFRQPGLHGQGVSDQIAMKTNGTLGEAGGTTCVLQESHVRPIQFYIRLWVPLSCGQELLIMGISRLQANTMTFRPS